MDGKKMRQRIDCFLYCEVPYWNGFLRWLIAAFFYVGLIVGGAWVSARINPLIGDLLDHLSMWIAVPLLIIVVFGWPILLLVFYNAWLLKILYNGHPFFDNHSSGCVCEEFLVAVPGILLIVAFLFFYLIASAIMSG